MAKTKKESIKEKKERISPLVYYKNPFYIIISLMILSLIIFYFTLKSYFVISFFLLLIATFYIRKNQCKKCKRVFIWKFIKKEHLSTDLEPHHYRIQNRYYYSNGKYMGNDYSEQKTITERVQKWREEYKCKCCGNEKHEDYKINLDESSRPSTINKVYTSVKAPRVCIICGSSLRSRRKYCSNCRPSGRSRPRF